MPQTSKRPRPQLVPSAPAPTTPAGQRLAAKIAEKEQQLEAAKQQIAAGQQHADQHMRLGINLEGQLVTLREEYAAAEGLPAPESATVPTPAPVANRSARRRAAATG